jgi:regulator of sigma E protease
VPLSHGMLTAIAAIAIFLALVFFHELGHFWVAKRVGILVREFALGFGPRLFSFRKGETLYSIRALPLGGYVNMAGENPEDLFFEKGEVMGIRLDKAGRIAQIGDPTQMKATDVVGIVVSADLSHDSSVVLETKEGEQRFLLGEEAFLVTPGGDYRLVPRERQFIGKPLWARAATIFAGPLMNFVLAVILFSIYFLHVGAPVNAPVVGGVEKGTPAAAAGIRAGDRIVAIDGRPIVRWDDMVTVIQAHPDIPLALEIERRQQRFVVRVAPANVHGVGQLGIDRSLTKDPVASVSTGIAYTWGITAAIVSSIPKLFSGAILHDVSGPVGIVSIIGSRVDQGFFDLVSLAGFLSINLGILNLFPIPALDGGRLLFLGVEAVRGRPVDPHKESMVHLVGFAFLMVLVILVTYNDVTRLF